MDWIHQTYRQAQERWREIAWSVAAFAAHLGDDSPEHPLDMYLAGAAGHRLDAAWLALDADFGLRVRQVLSRLPRADCAAEDLWSDTLVKLIEDDDQAPALADGRCPARIIRYRGRVSLLNYLIVIARRLAITRQRRSKAVLHTDITTRPDAEESPMGDWHAADPQPTPAQHADDHEQIMAMAQQLKDGMARLPADQHMLVSLVFGQGMKQKEAGALLGWSEFTTSRRMRSAMDLLRQSLQPLGDESWSQALRQAWAEALSRHWDANKSLQVSRSGASE